MMKRHTPFLLGLLCLSWSTASPFNLNNSYSSTGEHSLRIASMMCAVGECVSRWCEIVVERKVADLDVRIARLEISLEKGEELRGLGELDDSVSFERTERRIDEYRQELEREERQLQRLANCGAGFGALQGITALGNNKIEQCLEGCGKVLQFDTLAPECRGTRSKERRVWVLLECCLQIARSGGMHLENPETRKNLGWSPEQLMWVTAAQRLVQLVHTWRRNHDFSLMSGPTRLSFLLQLCNLVAGFFFPYRHYREGEWRVSRGRLSKEDVAILNDLRATTQPAELGAHELPTKDDGTVEPCTICLEDLGDTNGGTVQIVCDHCFHKDCLTGWEDEKRRALQNPHCPVCRGPSDRKMRPINLNAVLRDGRTHQQRLDQRLAQIQAIKSSRGPILDNCLLARIYFPLPGRSPLQARVARLLASSGQQAAASAAASEELRASDV